MRLFIGIQLSEEVKDGLSQLSRELKEYSAQLKWVKENNVHLTLKFLGKTDKKDQIMDTLNAAPKVKPFHLKFTGLGKFGKGADIRVLWAGIEPSEDLNILFDQIESSLEQIGFPREERKFSPHLTLARNRQGQIPEILLNRIKDLSDHPIADQRITSFQLFKSDLTISGPIYTTLSDFHLSQSP